MIVQWEYFQPTLNMIRPWLMTSRAEKVYTPCGVESWKLAPGDDEVCKEEKNSQHCHLDKAGEDGSNNRGGFCKSLIIEILPSL